MQGKITLEYLEQVEDIYVNCNNYVKDITNIVEEAVLLMSFMRAFNWDTAHVWYLLAIVENLAQEYDIREEDGKEENIPYAGRHFRD